MAEYQSQFTVSKADLDMSVDPGLRGFMLGIYQKIALGLVLTGAMSMAIFNVPALAQLLFNIQDGRITGYTVLGYVFAFAPLAMSFASGMFMGSLNAAKAGAFYWVFVAVMGISLSSVAFIYTGESIATMFFITAIAFGGLSLIGYTTKVNMTSWGSFLYMIVLGMIALSMLNFFWLKSPLVSMIGSAIGLVVFSGLIAYRTQSLKLMYHELGGAHEGRKAAMTYIGALDLYISFINLFMSLLNLFGGRR